LPIAFQTFPNSIEVNEVDRLKKKLADVLSAEPTDFQTFLELSAELAKHDKEHLRFVVDAGAITHLGKDSIKDHSTAVVELVKNSYDAGASIVQIDITTRGNSKSIRIADNGSGMTEVDVMRKWLRIGYSEKGRNRHIGTRRRTGEKGIGRISADRLGANLKLSTRAAKDKGFGLEVNWDEFATTGRDLMLVPFKRVPNPNFSFPPGRKPMDESGTELLIEGLRNDWLDADFKRLHEELSMLMPLSANRDDFAITITTDAETPYQGTIEPIELPKPELSINVTYRNDDDVEYIITDSSGIAKGPVKTPWRGLVQYVKDIKGIDRRDNLACGPLSFEIFFYPRESHFARGRGLSLQKLKTFLGLHGGVKIYRDQISVKPYGFDGKDGEDWLNLGERHAADPAGIARDTWSVLRSQLVGSVYIGRDQNENLQDSAGREGLIHNEAYYDLRALVLAGIRLLEIHRHAVHKELTKDKPKRPSSKQQLEEYRNELQVLRDELDELKTELEDRESEAANSARRQLELVITGTTEAEKSIEDLLDKNRTMGGLATIGISAAVFGHETQIAISHFKTKVALVEARMNDPLEYREKILSGLADAVSAASRIADWGSFALSKVRRDKRTRRIVDVHELVNRTLNDLGPAMKARTIEVIPDIDSISARSFEMDIEAVLLNLLTNSYSACLAGSEPRKIKVRLKQEVFEQVAGFCITVSDTGPGVPEELREIIWEPLFTTKTGGEGHETGFGLGLSIVQSIVEDLKGVREVSDDPELKGARFRIWLPIK
jgi:signal transduction histidine kinase